MEAFATWLKSWLSGTPPANIWIGVSVEDQKRADERIPLLLTIPARVRFLSVEPLLDCGVEAIVDVANQCKSAGVPCFVKQDCAAKPGQQGRIPETTWSFKQFPKP